VRRGFAIVIPGRAAGANPESIDVGAMDSGLAGGACLRAGRRPDPVARAPE